MNLITMYYLWLGIFLNQLVNFNIMAKTTCNVEVLNVLCGVDRLVLIESLLHGFHFPQ